MVPETTVENEIHSSYSVDELISNMQQPTEREASPPPPEPVKEPEPKPKPEQKEPENKAPSEKSARLASATVRVLSSLVSVTCQVVSGENDPELFQITAAQKKEVEEPVAELIEIYNWNIPPEIMLLLAIAAVYSIPVSNAISIRSKKQKIVKAEEGQNVADAQQKPGPGRPTKAQQTINKLNDDLANIKKRTVK